MKNIFYYRFTAVIILVLVLMLSACFAPPEPAAPEEYLTPQPQETEAAYDSTVNMALVTDDYVMESWPVIKKLYGLSGVKANFKTIRPVDWTDTIGRIMSSGEGYDFVELDSYSAYVYNDHLLDIAPYLDEYAPDFRDWALSWPSFASAYAYGQPITYFPFREDSNIFMGCAFADASLRNTNILTLNEFKEFMTGKQLMFYGSTRELVQLIAPYFGTSDYWYTKDEQMIYGPSSDEFREMLKTLNEFYSAGIIPEDYEYSPPSRTEIGAADNTAGVILGTEDDFEWLYDEGYSPVMLNFSEDAYIPSYPLEPSKTGGIIAGTGNEINVLKFINSCFSEDGRALLNYGEDKLHTLSHTDGSIEYLVPFSGSGDYQWKEQGLTPEGLPGIYYNSWAKYDEALLNELIDMRKYLPENGFLVPSSQIAYTSYLPKQIVRDSVENLQYEWWTAFIKGEKSLDWDWGEYLSQMESAGCMQGYLSSRFN
ncbi:MAG: hypothetical protein JXN65_07910 [Clostridia bacterium]|nr:hypothetical protein [Clostridia bacterium]